MKSDQDVESYNNEFHDLQQQLFQISQQAFNGSSLFASTVDRTASAAVLFKSTTNSQDHTIDIFTSDNGSEGTKISINRSALLSALTIDNQADAVTKISIQQSIKVRPQVMPRQMQMQRPQPL